MEGVPRDAVLTGVETNYLYGMNTKTGEIVEEHPLSVDVKFEREIDGMPVVGAGGEIDISLGEDGELLFLSKCWRSLEYAGEVKIISTSMKKWKIGAIIGAVYYLLGLLSVSYILNLNSASLMEYFNRFRSSPHPVSFTASCVLPA